MAGYEMQVRTGGTHICIPYSVLSLPPPCPFFAAINTFDAHCGERKILCRARPVDVPLEGSCLPEPAALRRVGSPRPTGRFVRATQERRRDAYMHPLQRSFAANLCPFSQQSIPLMRTAVNEKSSVGHGQWTCRWKAAAYRNQLLYGASGRRALQGDLCEIQGAAAGRIYASAFFGRRSVGTRL